MAVGQRHAQLAAITRLLDELGVDSDPIARRLIAEAHQDGADQVASQIKGLDITAPEIPGTFAGLQRDAIAALQDQLTGRLADARRTIGRNVEDVFARQQRRSVMFALLGAQGSPDSARRQLADTLAQRGRTAFVDRAGKRWALDSYADMAVRTVTREAAVTGAINRMASHGIDLARVSRHAEPCQICQPWEGRLVTLDGQTSTYQGEAVTDLGALPNGGPPFHPRCRHSLQPVAVRIEAVRRDLAAA